MSEPTTPTHPDLPKLEWPGNEPEEAEDAAAEPAPPRTEDVPVDQAWQVKVGEDDCIGHRNDPHERLPWTIWYPGLKLHDFMFDEEVTLIARLVPDTGSRP